MRALAPHLAGPAWSSASPPCRSAPPRGWTRCSQARRRREPTSSSPGTRSSSARATPSRTRCAPTAWSFGVASSGRDALLARRVPRRSIEAGAPGGGHRPRHRRAGQGRRQLVPGHQDLLHQRDGRGLRGDRRRRRRAGRRRWRTTSASAAGSSSRGSASAAAACPRTSGRSCTGPRSSAPGRRCRFLREVDAINQRRREPGRRPGRASMAGRRPPRRRGSPCSARPSSRNSDDMRDAPALDVAAQLHDAGADVVVYRPAGHGQRPARRTRSCGYAGSALEAAAGAGWWRCSPSGTSSGASTRRCSAGSSGPAPSSTPATRWTPHAWREAGWSYRALGCAGVA